MSEEYDFGKELAESVKKSQMEDKAEYISMVFKSYVAKLLEMVLQRSGREALETGAIDEVKKNLIVEFRKAKLGNYQRSIEQYEELFDKTIQEILNDAAIAHDGQDSATFDDRMVYNAKTGRLLETTPSGIWLPPHVRDLM